jgi:predicted ABC-type transport system involved in lysophospholipase L1 biosynthesis ATPase subunit
MSDDQRTHFRNTVFGFIFQCYHPLAVECNRVLEIVDGCIKDDFRLDH